MRRSSTKRKRRFSLSTRRHAPRALLEVRVLRPSPAAAAHAGPDARRRDPGLAGPAGDGAAAAAPGSDFAPRSCVPARPSMRIGRSRSTWPALAANAARFLGRDYPLDRQSDEAVLSRFDVRGYERLRATLSAGRGAILVGSHLGAHIAGVHWLFRRGVPLRLLVQRPRHVSRELNRRFDAGGPHPQAEMFLRRDLSPAVAVERVFRARAALARRPGDLLERRHPWTGPNTCAGRLLGRPQRFLAIWTELAVLTNAPVFLVFCTHLPGGRFALEIEAIGHLHSGEEESAVADYLKQLEARIEASPGRRSRAPGMAVLRVAPGAGAAVNQAKNNRREPLSWKLVFDRAPIYALGLPSRDPVRRSRAARAWPSPGGLRRPARVPR